MATIKVPTKDEAMELYQGFDSLTVGPGTDPDMYASDSYAKSKTKQLYIGSLADLLYSGADHDLMPTALVLSHISQWNVVLSVNIHYLNNRLRLAVIRYVLESNKNRIRDNLPIMIDWHSLKRNFPQVAGATRMYKLPLINVRQVYVLNEWEEQAKKPSRWDNHYKKFV